MRVGILTVLLLGCRSDEGVKVHNSAPTITIVSHSDGAELRIDYENTFQASVSDSESASSQLSVLWSSDQRELCPEAAVSEDGSTECVITLEEGETQIRVQVTDPDGATAIDSVDLNPIPTFAPSVELLSPLTDERYYSDQLILFSATMTDTEDSPSELSYTWSSSVDGDLQTSAVPNQDGLLEEYLYLSQGEHALTLTVTDLSNKTTSQSTTVNVGGINTSPSCGITQPEDGATYIQGETVIFTATATDAEIPGNELSTVWTSDRDGVLGTGTIDSDGVVTFSSSDLSTNTHTIQFSVEDEIGASCSDTVLLSVGTPPTLILTEPVTDSVYSVGEIVSFIGSLSDNEDVVSDIALSWVSSLDGEFSTQGANSNGNLQLNTSGLSTGLHSITVTATDSIGLTDSVSLLLRVNTLPTAPSVNIVPDPADTADSLLANATGSTDANGETVSYSYDWYLNGASTGSTSPTLSSTLTTRGDLWMVRVTPNDGYQDGPYTEASLVIQNSPPVVDSISITPAIPNTTDTLLCNVGVTELDGDTLTESYSWLNTTTGMILGSASSLTLSSDVVSPGETVECQYSVTDGVDSDGDSSTVYVANTGPTILSVDVTPTVAFNSTVLTCTIDVDDPDQLGYTGAYVWTNDSTGATLGTAETLLLDATLASPYDDISCSATAIDPSGAAGSLSNQIMLSNRDPIITDVNITPASAVLGDVIDCEAVVTEPDDEVPVVSYEWTDSSGLVLGSTSTFLLDATVVSGGDTVTCTAIVNDNYGGQAIDSNGYTIGNTGPSVQSLAVSSATATTADTITCTGTGADPDGDPLTEDYVWTNNSTGVVLGTTDTLVLTPLTASPGNTVTCSYQVSDATQSDSDTVVVTIQNSDPTVDQVVISPTLPSIGSLVTCTPTVSDPDLESTVNTILWTNDSTGQSIGSGASLTLDVTQALPNEQISCTVTAQDPSGGSDSASATATVQNIAPTISSISLSSSSIGLGGTTVCSVSATDPEGEIPVVSYVWENVTDGTVIANTASLTLDSSIATGSDELRCTATATDSYGASDTENVSIVVNSTAPVFISSAAISPSSGVTTAANLMCTGVATDPDGGTITHSYDWTNTTTGLSIGSSTSLTLDASMVQPTDVIICTITATDPAGESATSNAGVMVGNLAPTLASVSISPTSGIDTATALTCTAAYSDPDGETLTPTYQWENSGVVLGNSDTLTLTPGTVQPGDSVDCTATVEDGYGASDSLTTSVTVANTLPVISSVSISPDPGYNDSSLTCLGTATDADGSTLSLSYAWTNLTNGSSLGSGNVLALSSSLAAGTDEIQCTATATDPAGGSVSASVSLTLTNRAPNAATVLVGPSPAYVNSTIICTASALSDPDNDSLTESYAWTVNGVLSSTTTSSLSGGLSAGDSVQCTVTLSDGLVNGPSAAASLTVENIPPTVDTVTLSPATVYTDDTVTAVAVASDLDGDTLTLSYEWFVDGSSVQSGSSNTLSGALFSRGEAITVTATASDGNGTGSLTSSSLTCSNTPPLAPTLVLSPSSPIEGTDDLVCSASGSADADGDSVTYTFDWTVDGISFTGANDTSTTSTVTAATTNAGEEWECTATPTDGITSGSSVSDSVIIDTSSSASCAAVQNTLGGSCVDNGTDSFILQHPTGLSINGLGFDDNNAGAGNFQPRNVCMIALFGNGGSYSLVATDQSYGVPSGTYMNHYYGNCGVNSCSTCINDHIFTPGELINGVAQGNSCGGDGDTDSGWTELYCYF